MSNAQRISIILVAFSYGGLSSQSTPSSDQRSSNTSFGLVLSGGGPVEKGTLDWIGSKAGGGNIVVLHAGDKQELPDAWQVQSIVVNTPEAARNADTLNTIRQAQAVVIAGESGAAMAQRWKFTPVASALDFLASKQAVIAGLEDAAPVLGAVVFTARQGDILPEEALSNPLDTRITLEAGVFTMPYLGQVVIENHFSGSQRMGRMLTFLARVLEDQIFTEARGIGIDEGSAVLMDQEGKATLSGPGAAYFLRSRQKAEVCRLGMPLSFGHVEIYKLQKSGAFDTQRWSGKGGISYQVSVMNGKLVSTQRNSDLY